MFETKPDHSVQNFCLDFLEKLINTNEWNIYYSAFKEKLELQYFTYLYVVFSFLGLQNDVTNHVNDRLLNVYFWKIEFRIRQFSCESQELTSTMTSVGNEKTTFFYSFNLQRTESVKKTDTLPITPILFEQHEYNRYYRTNLSVDSDQWFTFKQGALCILAKYVYELGEDIKVKEMLSKRKFQLEFTIKKGKHTYIIYIIYAYIG